VRGSSIDEALDQALAPEAGPGLVTGFPISAQGVSLQAPAGCPMCGRSFAPAPVPALTSATAASDDVLIGPAAAAAILGLTAQAVRRMDKLLAPVRRPNGSRLYRRSLIEERARAHPPQVPGELGEWLSLRQVARIVGITEQRIRDMDDVLNPQRLPVVPEVIDPSTGAPKLQPRRYHRTTVLAELKRRGVLS
jgi:hypothetical protein